MKFKNTKDKKDIKREADRDHLQKKSNQTTGFLTAKVRSRRPQKNIFNVLRKNNCQESEEASHRLGEILVKQRFDNGLSSRI